ncbi:MAG: hypothetical protein HYX41_07350 [Bdellovibrio sp.]|nr:hypothetical protein [Bdellovibrio sp.]
MRQVSQVVLTAVFFTICTSPWLAWKGIVSVFPFWAGFEFIYRWRMRAALPCPHCGFDPYLFLIDEDWAKKEVEAHWRKKFADHGIPYPEKGKPAEGASPPASPPGPSPEEAAKASKGQKDSPGSVRGESIPKSP